MVMVWKIWAHRTGAIVGVSYIVDNYFGRPKDFIATAITTLKCLKYHMVWLRWVLAHADGFVIPRVEWPADALFGFDAIGVATVG